MKEKEITAKEMAFKINNTILDRMNKNETGTIVRIKIYCDKILKEKS